MAKKNEGSYLSICVTNCEIDFTVMNLLSSVKTKNNLEFETKYYEDAFNSAICRRRPGDDSTCSRTRQNDTLSYKHPVALNTYLSTYVTLCCFALCR